MFLVCVRNGAFVAVRRRCTRCGLFARGDRLVARHLEPRSAGGTVGCAPRRSAAGRRSHAGANLGHDNRGCSGARRTPHGAARMCRAGRRARRNGAGRLPVCRLPLLALALRRIARRRRTRRPRGGGARPVGRTHAVRRAFETTERAGRGRGASPRRCDGRGRAPARTERPSSSASPARVVGRVVVPGWRARDATSCGARRWRDSLAL